MAFGDKVAGAQKPNITNLDEITEFLTENVPEVNFITAHGQMAGKELESRMTAFYDGQYDYANYMKF